MKTASSASSLRIVLTMLCLVLALSTCAWTQQNLLANPGFETGDFTGWTVNGTSSNFGVNTAGFVITGTDPRYGTETVLVHSGTQAGYAVVCRDCSPAQYLDLQQPVNLIPGNVYTVSFWVGNSTTQAFGNDCKVTVNGTAITLSTYPNDIFQGYNLMSGRFIATQANATIDFRIEGSGTAATGFSFDDFSLALASAGPSNGGYTYQVSVFDNTIASFQMNPFTGALTPGIGSPFPSGSGTIAAVNLGLLVYVADETASKISAFTTDFRTGTLTPVPGSPFATTLTPLTVNVDRALGFLYASGFNNGSGAVSGWKYDHVSGVLTPIPGSPFAAGSEPIAIAFSRNGRNAYVVDIRTDSLLAYAITPATGALSPLPGSPYTLGAGPEAIAVQSFGNFLYVANAGDNNIQAFHIDGLSGALTPVPGSPFPTGSGPYSLAFDGAQHFLYAANSRSGSISGYAVNSSTGALTPVSGSPFPSSMSPNSMTSSQNFLYVNAVGSGLESYQINPTTGTLTSLGQPYPSYGSAMSVNGNSSGTAH